MRSDVHGDLVNVAQATEAASTKALSRDQHGTCEEQAGDQCGLGVREGQGQSWRFRQRPDLAGSWGGI